MYICIYTYIVGSGGARVVEVFGIGARRACDASNPVKRFLLPGPG